MPADLSGLVESSTSIMFLTANGPVPSGPMYPGLLGPFDECIAPFVLDSSPALLTVGKRCMDRGYGFHWFPYKAPFMVKPDGGIVKLEVHGDIPYLAKGAVASPAQGRGTVSSEGPSLPKSNKKCVFERIES